MSRLVRHGLTLPAEGDIGMSNRQQDYYDKIPREGSGTSLKSRVEGQAEILRDDTIPEYPFRDHHPSVDELYGWYDELVAGYPNLITKIRMGYSAEGRDLWVLEVTSDGDTQVDHKPGFLVDGTMHAREWSTTQAASYFMWRLLTEYDIDPTIHWLLNNRRIYVIPMLNPDGYIYDGDGAETLGHHWRKNRNDATPTDEIGVDLNRNWDHYWDWGNSDPAAVDYQGEAPFSECETEHLRSFMLSRTIDSYQNLHSFGGMLLFPWGYPADRSPHDDWYRGMASHMTTHTSKMGDENLHYSYGQPYEEVCYAAPGASLDWLYATTGAQALVFELETGDGEWYPDPEHIMTINKDVYDALVYQTRVADVDLGDGTTLLFPPVPYIAYGTVTDSDGAPVVGTTVTLENLDTEETLSITTDMNGYYELNWGNLVEHGCSLTDACCLSVGAFSTHFTIGDEWGVRVDVEIPACHLTISSTAGGLVMTPGEGVFTYTEATVVGLGAEPREGYRFVNWTGDVAAIGDANASTTTITMEGDWSISANFRRTSNRPLVRGIMVAVAAVGLVPLFLLRRRRRA